MSDFKSRIQQDLIVAMKAKDEVKVSALRMLKAAILKFEVSGQRKEASAEDIAQLVKKEIKQRQDAVEQYRQGNREDLAQKEEVEASILLQYMPSQMNQEQVEDMVRDILSKFPAGSKP